MSLCKKVDIEKEPVKTMIMIYDSLTRTKRVFEPINPPEVSIYVCGVTPYAESHLGHARPAILWDVIKRHLMRRGYLVRHVQNFTDIDDKLVARSRDLGTSVSSLASLHIDEYVQWMNQLGVLPPDYTPRVTENLSSIIDFIEGLIAQNQAYATTLGNVYFRVDKYAEYGRLSGRTSDAGRLGVRVELADDKENPLDFALWKAALPHEEYFTSPWGRGRPGWHIECSAMSSLYLGQRFDLHGGGIDLMFPHHENELAQSKSYFGTDPAGCWVHNGMITQGNVKMSKSLGNGTNLGDLLNRYPAMALRSYLLSVQYRNPLDFSEEALADWTHGMERVWQLWERVRNVASPSRKLGTKWENRLASFEERFLACLDDDFNTARALAEVFDLVHDVYRGVNEGETSTALGWARINLQKAHDVLGLLPVESDRSMEMDPLVTRLLTWREQARRDKNFLLGDEIRVILEKSGWVVEDRSDGSNMVTRRVEVQDD